MNCDGEVTVCEYGCGGGVVVVVVPTSSTDSHQPSVTVNCRFKSIAQLSSIFALHHMTPHTTSPAGRWYSARLPDCVTRENK